MLGKVDVGGENVDATRRSTVVKSENSRRKAQASDQVSQNARKQIPLCRQTAKCSREWLTM